MQRLRNLVPIWALFFATNLVAGNPTTLDPLTADDYVTKPFSTRVLLARVAALLRRQAARARKERSARRVGKLGIDAERLAAVEVGDRCDEVRGDRFG